MLKTRRVHSAEIWIERLRLQPHPEGGWYRETYRSDLRWLPPGYRGSRCASTAIYYLLRYPEFSAFHKLNSDETWHFYDGGPVIIHELTEDGLKSTRLAGEPAVESTLQHTVPANTWFAAEPERPGDYALMGCTVAPGFDFADFEMADRNTLQSQYPQHSRLIDRLCAG